MYYERHLDKVITSKKSAGKVRLLLGPRQSGKSTLLKHSVKESADTMFINLQNRRERIKYEKNPEVFLQELEAAKHINTVIIDEIQKVPGLLEDTYIGLRVSSFGRSRKKIITAPRFLIFDIGMRNVLAELPLNKSLIQLDAGHLFKQFIMTELFFRCQYYGKSYKLSTWRTATGAEVDAVLETPEEVIPIEIKWTDSPNRKDIRHVETFLELHKDISQRGFIICRTDSQRQLSKRITALPWNKF